jgi:TonB-linked SusC/RagA family outer membrane protein
METNINDSSQIYSSPLKHRLMKRKLRLKGWARHAGNALLFLLLFATLSATAQNKVMKSISGNITDSNGNPVVGVTVRVKSTNIGTTSDDNGNYAIKVPQSNTVLTYSSIGYVAQSVYIKGRSIMNIQLKRQSNSLAEAVVVGYGTQKKANLTGSVATVNMQQIQDIPVSNLSAALKYSDKLPGVHVSGGEARPGAAGNITIRNPPAGGKNGPGSGPLYVIDGVIRTQQDFNLLDPNQIESISVVKDATAAIYGANAAQGVILVTTKKGKRGALSVNYNSSYGASNYITVPKMMNGYQEAVLSNDGLITQGEDSTNPDYYTSDELAYFKKHNYNWFDMAWKPSFTTSQSLGISGGDKKATYYAGASYYYGDGNVNKINYNKWDFHASTNMDITNYIHAGLQVDGNVSNQDWFFLKQGGEDPERDVNNLLATPRNTPPYIRGLPVLIGQKNRGSALNFFEVQNLDNYTKSNYVILNVNANLEYDVPFVPGLKVKVIYNKNYNNAWGKQYGTRYNAYSFTMLGTHHHIYGGQIDQVVEEKNGDRVRINPAITNAYQFNTNLSYDRQFGKSHLSVLALMEQSQSYSESVSAEKDDVANVGVDYMQAAFGAMTTGNSADEAGALSFAGRVNYSYADTYIAEFDWRYDGSTLFAKDYRWGFFPAFSFAWIISNENFFQSSLFDFLKLRGSAGLLGRASLSPWSYFQRYTLEAGGHGAVFGGNSDRTTDVKLVAAPNPYVQWDNMDEYNVGIDANLFNDHLSINMDGYYDHGYNLLSAISSSVPLTVGSAIPAENFGIANSMGYELTVSWQGMIGKNFHYSITSGAGYENSVPVKVDVSSGIKGTYLDPTGVYTRNRGQLAYVYEGMFRDWEQVDAFMKQHPGYTIFGQKPQPGMLYYKDVRGPQVNGKFTKPDGVITEADQVYINPKRGFNKGVSFGLRWKGLSLHLKTGFSIGSKEFIPSQARKQPQSYADGPVFWADHWTPANIDATYPDPYWNDDYEPTSGFWLRNSSYFQIELVNMSYQMPEQVVRSLGLNSCRFYLVLTNPLHVQNQLLTYDLDYPELRTTTLGVSVNL